MYTKSKYPAIKMMRWTSLKPMGMENILVELSRLLEKLERFKNFPKPHSNLSHNLLH